MSIFLTGVTTLFVAAAVFYIIFFSFIYYWHLKKITYVILPVIFVFEFFAMGFLIVAIVSIILEYVPILVRAYGL